MGHENNCSCHRKKWRRRWQWLITYCIMMPYMSLSYVAAEQRFANEPSPQTAIVGSTVVLPCRIINRVGELQWTRDDFGLGNERELYAFKRYHMIGSDEEGDFSLRISPITLEDDAEFQCQVTGSKDIPGVRSQTAKLTVYVPPEPPQILQGKKITVTEGETVRLECISLGGKPAAELHWMDASGQTLTDGVHYTSELMSDRQRSNAKSTLNFEASKIHHKSVFRCSATNPALGHSITTDIKIKVRYSPQVTLTGDQKGYREGQSATFTCSADSNPDVISYRWYRGGQLVSDNNNSTQMVIPNITKDITVEDITCEVSNEVGSNKKVTHINIHYGPTFTTKPTDLYAELGENISLKCEVDSSPEAEILWLKDGQVMGKGSELRIIATRVNIGAFMCVAKVEGFPDISATASIFLKGPPRITSEREQWGNQGETVLVECIIAAASAPSLSVTWTHNGKLVDLEKGRYEVVQDVTAKGVRHTLVIRDAQVTDFGPYKCSVHNEYGSDVSEIILSKKKTLPMLLLVCGVTGGVMLVLVMAMVVIMCAKKNAASSARHKGVKTYSLPEKAPSLQPNDQNSSANESDLKVEFDQRTGSSMSNKDVEMDGWDQEGEHPTTPPFLSASTNPYLYPDSFTAVPVKANGHINNGRHSYDNYADHTALINHQLQQHQQQQQQQQQRQSPLQQQAPSPTRGFIQDPNNSLLLGGAGAGLGTLGCHHLSDALYPMYSDYNNTNHDTIDGFKNNCGNGCVNGCGVGGRAYSPGGISPTRISPPGFSPTFTSPFAEYSFKNTCSGSSSPPPLQLTLQPPTTKSNGTLGRNSGTIGKSNGSNGTLGRINGSLGRNSGTLMNGNDSLSVPRLGIPVDPSMYIMSPKTQVLEGTLATHV